VDVPASLLERFAVIEVRISEGSCTGRELYRETVRRDGIAPGPPVLGPGTYCFAAKIGDESCTWFAGGERTEQLPLAEGGPVTISVTPIAESAACDRDECDEGLCASVGADAGMDADALADSMPPTDSTPADAPFDAPPVDSAPMCSSPCDETACPPTFCMGTSCQPLGVSYATGVSHNLCAVAPDGSLWCWGRNTSGALGLGDTSARDRPARVGTETDWATVGTGFDWACAIKTSGALYCWGANGAGQLGLGDTMARMTPTRVGSDTDWESLGPGQYHNCAIKTSGALYCWGEGGQGRTGLGTTGDRSTPQRVGSDSDWAMVAGRDNHTCGVKAGGELYCWGDNANGQLGIGSAGGTRQTPTLVPGRSDWVMADVGGSGLAGGRYSCALTTGGELYCWGDGDNGVLGQGDRLDSTSPVRVGTDEYDTFQTGLSHVCAVRTDGALFCWGEGSDGQLGTGDTGDRLVAGRVGTESDWAGVVTTTFTSCGWKTSGRIYCWGDDSNGERGDGSGSSDVSSPVRSCL
jgi:alpha-tubulin suppressor-like RCC1 family protein